LLTAESSSDPEDAVVEAIHDNEVRIDVCDLITGHGKKRGHFGRKEGTLSVVIHIVLDRFQLRDPELFRCCYRVATQDSEAFVETVLGFL
jgi:hypothetical protein